MVSDPVIAATRIERWPLNQPVLISGLVSAPGVPPANTPGSVPLRQVAAKSRMRGNSQLGTGALLVVRLQGVEEIRPLVTQPLNLLLSLALHPDIPLAGTTFRIFPAEQQVL
jgi:hypothetical protein